MGNLMQWLNKLVSMFQSSNKYSSKTQNTTLVESLSTSKVKKKIDDAVEPQPEPQPEAQPEPQKSVLSDTGIQHLEQWEGRRNRVYDDATGKEITNVAQAKGYPTIGIGHLLTKDELNSGKIKIGDEMVNWRNGLTDEQINQLARQDTAIAAEAVEKHVEAPLTQNQRDALISFAFNIGANAFKNAGAIKALNEGDIDDFLRRHAQWRKSGGKVMQGLVNRRAAEAELFQRV